MLFHPTVVVVRGGNIGRRKLRNELIKYGVFTTKLENLIEHTDNQFIMTNKNSSQNITIGEMKTHVEEVHDYSWEINYDGAQFDFLPALKDEVWAIPIRQ